MRKRNFLQRVVVPVSIVFLTVSAAYVTYFNSSAIGHEPLRHAVAFVSGIVLFFSIGLGPLVVYPMAYFRGASPWERIAASLFTPLAWIVKDLFRVSEFFTPGETLYYAFNPLFLLTIIGAFALMGICEMACRWRAVRRGESRLKVITPGPVFAAVTGVVAVYVLLIWGVGVHWFYIYMEGYRALFH
jgi:hypothetical protein